MSQRSSYAAGVPCWIDLGAEDIPGAQEFYGRLLGWSFDEGSPETGYYSTCRLDGRAVAAIAPKQDPSIPSMWSTYLASDDVEATAAKITDNGGQVMLAPMEVMEFGRMAYAADPTGAVFGVWQAGTMIGAELVNEPGTWVWNDLNTRDGAAADAFYGTVFGYEFAPLGDGQAFDYNLYKVGTDVTCGRMQMDERWPAEVPAHWMTYFAVADTDAAVARVSELGGSVTQAPRDSDFGRLAAVADPWGAAFSIIKAPAEG